MLTSLWENDTTVLQYKYCENIMDGRGYTSGRAGFCTGCGDARQVVQCLTAKAPNNALAKYQTALATLSSGDTAPLDAIGAYCKDWTATALDAQIGPQFKQCQDDVTTNLYESPGCADAHMWGIHLPLFLAELYDAEINHGEPDVQNMLSAAGRQAGVTQLPSGLATADESKLLASFLSVRVGILSKDPTWLQAVDRLAVYEKERRAGNLDLVSRPVTTDAHSSTYWSDAGALPSSGYSICTLTAGNGTVSVSGDPACTAN